MTTSKIELVKLTASAGMTLTNGEVYGKEVYLGKGDSPDNWYEITDEEAERIQAGRSTSDELLSSHS